MIGIVKDTAGAHFRLRRQDIGSFASMKGRGTQFRTRVYDAEGAGRLCLMKMRAFAGIMRMETGVFSPTDLDGPIFSFDYIRVVGKETLFLEFYDTTLTHPGFEKLGEIKGRYAYIPEYDPGEHWYDSLRLPVSDFKRGRKIRRDLRQMVQDYSEMYFNLLAECAPCDAGEKKKCNAAFVDGLLNNGGPAVDSFEKMMGRGRTEDFLRQYMFCCR